jgi:Conidiation protein 6
LTAITTDLIVPATNLATNLDNTMTAIINPTTGRTPAIVLSPPPLTAVAGGYKAASKNPNVSGDAKQNAKDQLRNL